MLQEGWIETSSLIRVKWNQRISEMTI
jgi:hypothetical protein